MIERVSPYFASPPLHKDVASVAEHMDVRERRLCVFALDFLV